MISVRNCLNQYHYVDVLLFPLRFFYGRWMYYNMKKAVFWENNEGNDYSIEYFNLISKRVAHILRGTVILFLEQVPILVRYEIVCDRDWKTRSVRISQQVSEQENRYIELGVNEDQIWRKQSERPSSYSSTVIEFASGLYDIDLQITPATNSLPINRCSLKKGDSQQIQVLLIGFPGLTLEQQEQRYSNINDKLYWFEIPSTGFEKRLLVDEFGLVINYDSLWHRLY